MMLRIIEEGFCARLTPGAKSRSPSLTGLIIILTIVLLAGVQSSPVFAEDWGSWLQKKGSEIYEDSKKAIQDYSTSSEKGNEPAKDQGATAPKHKEPQHPSADAPRYGKQWITEIQTRLTELGYQPGPIDGAFGYRSKVAIRNYQQQRGLQVTGEPTPSVMQALRGEPQVASTGQANPTVKALTPEQLSVHTTFAYHAGIYAGMADGCKDPAGAQVREELKSRAATVSANDGKYMTAVFEQEYQRVFNKFKESKGSCRNIETPKRDYESSLQKIGAAPIAGNGTQVNAPQIPPAGTQTMSDSKLRDLTTLAGLAGTYAARANACNRAIGATIRPDFIAQIAGEYPEHQQMLTSEFDNVYRGFTELCM